MPASQMLQSTIHPSRMLPSPAAPPLMLLTPVPPSPVPSSPTLPAPQLSTAPVVASQPDADLEALADQIAVLAAHIHAATYRLLVLISEFDRREGWAIGFRTCAHWLSWRTGINLGAAREKVRVARALESLPLLSGGLRRGRLSYAKVRALTRVATPVNEQELLDIAFAATAAQTERLVRAWRRLDRIDEQGEEQRRHESRFLSLHPSEDGGMWELRGRLDPEVGAVLLRALEAAVDALFRSDDGDTGVTYSQRLADAAGLVGERALQAGLSRGPDVVEVSDDNEVSDVPEVSDDAPRPRAADSPGANVHHRADRYQVIVKVEAADLEEDADPGGGDLEDGVRVSAETSRRVSCDASKVVIRRGPDGETLDVGRRTRTVPPSIRRALERRDGGCRFPGCGGRFTDAHHVRHWADGGATRLDNLILLCRRHHRAVHEGGVRMHWVDGEPRFHPAGGRLLPQAPHAPPLPVAAVRALQDWHRADGLIIDARTASSRWQGEPFDVGFALEGLRPRDP